MTSLVPSAPGDHHRAVDGGLAGRYGDVTDRLTYDVPRPLCGR